MDRTEWLQERRRASEHRYDSVYSQTYDEDDSPISPVHRRFVTRMIETCPRDGRILDVPCGTGKYFGMVLDAGREVTGCDQSAGMLAQAAAKHPGVDTNKIGLQELDYQDEYDAVMCVDAMENVFPEHWPLVVGNLRRALRPGGHLYLTVEMTDADFLVKAFATATAQGLPVVPNEDTTRGEGYHYYPPLDEVRGWLDGAGLDLVEEAHSDGDHPSYSYEHFLCRRAAGLGHSTALSASSR
jgi:SAM-dependent methyltransferase